MGTIKSPHAPKEKEIILVSADEFSRTIVIILASVIPLTSVLQWNFKASQLRSSELAYFPTTFTRSSLFTQTYLPRMKNPRRCRHRTRHSEEQATHTSPMGPLRQTRKISSRGDLSISVSISAVRI